MIRLMLDLVKIIVAAFIALLFSSCRFEGTIGKTITGSGNVVSKTRAVDKFDEISVARGLDCEVIQSDQTSVVVEADDNLQEGIITTVEDGKLKISSIYNNYNNVKSKKVIVHIPNISVLESSSGSSLSTNSTIKSSNLVLKSSSGSSLIAKVECEKVTCDSSSGSHQEVEGKAIELETSSSSGSSIDADRLLVNEVDAQSSSGSTTVINPILSLKAHASSGSSIAYVKRPVSITVDKSSGGSVGQD